MDKEELIALIKRYQAGQHTDTDLAILETWYLTLNADGPLEISSEDLQSDLASVRSSLNLSPAYRSRLLWPKIAVAASLLCAIAIGWYTYKSPVQPIKKQQPAYVDRIVPGSDKAILVLADNKTINLTTRPAGEVTLQPGSQLVKTSSGELVYYETGNSPEHKYNTIQIPKGGKYKLRLPDGSKVWLNAASTLTYPTAFTSLKERRVKLNGEAYFEVTKNKALPFLVETENQLVEVLGTHFNINSYDDENAVKTTLLEGRIRLDHRFTLKPGQQAIKSSTATLVNQVDTKLAVEWKNEDFGFHQGDDFKTSMRKIARWYDVDIDYRLTVPPEIDLGGWVSRKKPINNLLKLIESTGNVHFKIEGRRIVVSN